MSEYLKMETGKPYFITLTIVEWIDLFTRECYVNIMLIVYGIANNTKDSTGMPM